MLTLVSFHFLFRDAKARVELTAFFKIVKLELEICSSPFQSTTDS